MSAGGTEAVSPARGTTEEAERTLAHVRGLRDEFTDFLAGLCRIESPTHDAAAQSRAHDYLQTAFAALDYAVEIIPGAAGGDHLLARPLDAPADAPTQLLVGHSDTVWPLGTLAEMPVEEVEGRLHGPGSLDMKGGLTQMVFAIRALRDLGDRPSVTPVVFINCDEEVGSPDSRPHVMRLAKAAARAFVLEPSLGPSGLIKTARKGVGRFEVRVRGRAAHAGLDPEAGASAIVELSHLIQRLNELNDLEHGTTVNVGRITGGTRPNVVAAEASATVDVRVVSAEAGKELERRVRSIAASDSRVDVTIEGGVRSPPLERTPRNCRLWERARRAGALMGLDLQDGMAGGGSDGNTTSQHTATLDGLGCVGDGAHADHEHIVVDASLERCALLARLLLLPNEPEGPS